MPSRSSSSRITFLYDLARSASIGAATVRASAFSGLDKASNFCFFSACLSIKIPNLLASSATQLAAPRGCADVAPRPRPVSFGAKWPIKTFTCPCSTSSFLRRADAASSETDCFDGCQETTSPAFDFFFFFSSSSSSSSIAMASIESSSLSSDEESSTSSSPPTTTTVLSGASTAASAPSSLEAATAAAVASCFRPNFSARFSAVEESMATAW
mmetsp:Transcript_29250/g.98581  ORF Transcript_29250/g.98581 Transcript_29250/m.98581 type:complete len:213 (+) Transcript_29250:1948-2586(+)